MQTIITNLLPYLRTIQLRNMHMQMFRSILINIHRARRPKPPVMLPFQAICQLLHRMELAPFMLIIIIMGMAVNTHLSPRQRPVKLFQRRQLLTTKILTSMQLRLRMSHPNTIALPGMSHILQNLPSLSSCILAMLSSQICRLHMSATLAHSRCLALLHRNLSYTKYRR